MTRQRAAMFFTTLAVLCSAAQAHEVRPGFLELRQTAAGRFDVTWKVPMRGDLRLALQPRLPASCVETGPRSNHVVPGAQIQRWSIACDEGLAGGTLRIDGLESTITDVMLRVQWLDGTAQTHFLRAAAPAVTLGDASEASTPVLGYVRLGLEHILLGVDHLLFVLGLLLIVSRRWMLFKTITSFTLAHSITLAIATLGYASAPVPPLNAAIALSILFLGPEIVRTWRGETSFTIRHPWIVAFVFGLLHGFGFASGLSTTGLPPGEIPLALLFFNVGVEIGQVGFVLVVLLLLRSFRQLEIAWPRWVAHLPGYSVGTLGAFWTIQRTLMLIGGAG